jgi:hypothetical protein
MRAAIADNLREEHDMSSKTTPCPGECGHTDIEHQAFDRGMADGEAGRDEIPAQYKDREMVLSEAWYTGHSVGVMNRAALDRLSED